MKRILLLLLLSLASYNCLAVGTIYVVFSYKLDGVQHTENLTLGVGGKQEFDYDRTGESGGRSVAQFEWGFNSSTGYDFRFGIERGYSTFKIGRQAGGFASIYKAVSGGSASRIYFGGTYELDVSTDGWASEHITDAYVTTSPFTGIKITNMTGEVIKYGIASTYNTIEAGTAEVFPQPVTRFLASDWDSTWEVHSEQDWSTTFTPTPFQSLTQDFPIFANFVIYKASTKPTIHKLKGALVYGDMNPSSDGKILFGSSGSPLYSIKDILDTFEVMTEWVFDQSSAYSPNAYINGDCVCSGHSTTHIIDYVIATDDNWRYDASTGCFVITFTMSMDDSGSAGSYSVVQRCWNSDYETYDETPSDERASQSVSLGAVSTFRASFNRTTGDKKLELVQ